MLSSLLLAASFQIGPFYEQKESYAAVRPVVSREGETVDVAWPLFTRHRDWWRFAYVVNWQRSGRGGFQFSVAPLWFNGRDPDKGAYAGLFPLLGSHPHILTVYDLKFGLWPLWMQYSVPRPSEKKWLETTVVLFPFVNWRSDGSWAVWPLYGVKRQRESLHRYALWPLFTWASYSEDRDTSGAGSSWMFWPLCGSVCRERERQTMFLPPLFSWTRTSSPALEAKGRAGGGFRLRCPWPLFEMEKTPRRSRLSVFPFFEDVSLSKYGGDGEESGVMRFGWKAVELYREKGEVQEVRVFPFWVKNSGYFRLWPFWETSSCGGTEKSRCLALLPIRWIPAVDRNWSKFWTFYERERTGGAVKHSLFWGIISWGGGE